MNRVVLAVLVLAQSGCAVGALMGYRLSPDPPSEESQTTKLAGLKSPVTVAYDAWGIPHIQAQNALDLMRADGYVQARARFFEMDLMRRFARGRVSELIGEQPMFGGTSVDFDLQMRGWQLEQRAASGLDKLSPEARAELDAFCDGVNAGLAESEPLEYRLLGTKPAPWTPQDTLVVGLLNAWSVSHNWHQEAVRLVLALNVGLDAADKIYPNEPLGGGHTLASVGAATELLPAIAPELSGMFPPRPPVGAEPTKVTSRLAAFSERFAGASNGWVVDGAHSKSGKPLLANDPHLEHLLPSMVFQQQLEMPGLDVVGVTIPGIPYVLIGHNQRVAWGMTSAVADVIDLVIEKPDPAHPGQLLHESGPCSITSEPVTINVHDGDELVPRHFTLRETCDGPVLNDLYPALFDDKAPLIAIRWHVEGVEQAIEILAKADRANSVAELQKSLGLLPSPVAVFEAADVDGHIGLFLSGTVPVRTGARGTFPVPGWLDKYAWHGELGTFDLPHALDPGGGELVHANNLLVDPHYANGHPVGIDSAPAYRRDRIAKLIAEQPKQDPDRFQKIQTDVELPRAEKLVPVMLADLASAKLDANGETARALLAKWDFVGSADSAAAAIFFQTFRFAILDALDDKLPPTARTFFLAERYSTNITDGWFESVDNPVWDDRRTPAAEKRADVVRRAFGQAMDALAKQQGSDPSKWRWGALHKYQPRHPFGGKSALAGTVNLPEMEDAGGIDSVWMSHFDLGNAKEPFRTMAGPVYRMVVDMGDLAHGRWVIDSGSSGWAHTAHYGDQYEVWKKGELLPMLFDDAEVRAKAAGIQTLTPE